MMKRKVYMPLSTRKGKGKIFSIKKEMKSKNYLYVAILLLVGIIFVVQMVAHPWRIRGEGALNESKDYYGNRWKGIRCWKNNLDYFWKALKYRHFRGYGQGIYYRFTTFEERALICTAPREPDARRGRHTDSPYTMTISYTDHDGVSSLPTRGEKGRRFFYALCYAVGA